MGTPKNGLRQTGSTLISLMVGMVISLLTILAALTLYRTVGNTVFGTSSVAGNRGTIAGANQDGQLASGLLRAQIAIQNAGFGIPTPLSNTHFLNLGSATLTPVALTPGSFTLAGTPSAVAAGGTPGYAVVWQTNPGLSLTAADYACGGLVSDATTNALYYISVSTGCAALGTQYGTLAWKVVTLIAPQVLDQAVTFSSRNSPSGTPLCWPFGALPLAATTMNVPDANLRVDIIYRNSTLGSANTFQTCLSNFKS